MIGALFFDDNNNPIPVPKPTISSRIATVPTQQTHLQATDPCGNSNCNCGRYQPHQQPPAPAFPPYKGAFKSRMQEWSYPRKRSPGFEPKSAQGRKSGTESTPTVQEGQQGAPAAAPKGTTKERIYKAFENLKARVEGAEHEFYNGVDGVAYKFVLGKVSKRMADAGECAKDQHDVTNKILSELSRRNLDEIKDIYKVLCSAAKKQGWEAFLENKEDRDMHVPLIVDKEDDNGEVYKEGNPLIHLNDLRPVFRRELPAFIQGIDLEICNYIREDYNYARIAEILSMTEAAVKQRIASMRNSIKEMRARGEV